MLSQFNIISENVSSNPIHPKSRAEWRKWLEENHTCTEFEAFPPFVKRVILEWIVSLKRTEEAISKAEKNICVNKWRQQSQCGID
jgi:hypothetical protein